MKNIVLIAPPGGGKGSISRLLNNKYHYNSISTGELLRKEVEQKTKIGREIESIIAAGDLVSDEIINIIIKKSLTKGKPFVLDGYPRSINQAEELDRIIDNYVVIYLDLDYEKARERILGRILCPKCQRTYNKYIKKMQPKNKCLCDECNIPLLSRSDDNEKSLEIRFKVFNDNFKKIIKKYKQIKKLVIIQADQDPEKIIHLIGKEIDD